MQYLGQYLKKNFFLNLKFILCWVSCVLSGNPLGREVRKKHYGRGYNKDKNVSPASA